MQRLGLIFEQFSDPTNLLDKNCPLSRYLAHHILDSHLSTFLGTNSFAFAICIGHIQAFDTEFCLERSRGIVYARMDHTTVMGRLVHC